jgi:hypothetical protein
MATDSPDQAGDAPRRRPVGALKVESEGLLSVAGKTKYSFRSGLEDLAEGRPRFVDRTTAVPEPARTCLEWWSST